MICSVSESCVRDTLLTVSKEGGCYRVSWSSSARKNGFVESDNTFRKKSRKHFDKLCSRSDSSIVRTRSIVRQYARCNEWDYFVTFTINPSLWDSFDLRTFYKSFSSYFNNLNYRRKDCKKLIYVLIPEQHKSGAWHFHGLMSGIPESHLEYNKNGYLDYPKLRDKFGFCSLSPIRDHEAVALYITKYITKDALQSDIPRGYRFILASHGLKKAKKLRQVYGLSFNILKKYLGDFDYKTDDFAVLTFYPLGEGVDEEKWLHDIDDIISKVQEEQNNG